MAHIWDDDFSERDDSSRDPANDFESFLRQKVEKCIEDKPASLLQSIPSPAKSVGDDSKSDSSRPIPEASLPEGLRSVQDVESIASRDIKIVQLSTKSNDLGTRKEEILVEEQRVMQVDEEWVRISNESFTTAVINLSCEQVITRFHDLNRLRFLIPAQQYGLQKALEELLKSRNSEDRAKLLELDKSYRSKQKARSATTKAPKEKVAKEKRAVSMGNFKATAGTKSAESLKALGFDKGYIVNNLMERGLLGKIEGAYIAKLFENVDEATIPNPDNIPGLEQARKS